MSSIVEALPFSSFVALFLYKISFLGSNLQRRVGRFITLYFISSPSRMSPPLVSYDYRSSYIYILQELCSWFECCLLSGGHASSARCSVNIVVGGDGGSCIQQSIACAVLVGGGYISPHNTVSWCQICRVYLHANFFSMRFSASGVGCFVLVYVIKFNCNISVVLLVTSI